MLKKNWPVMLLIIAILITVFLLIDLRKKAPAFTNKKINYWTVQSIDTVKYSRDPARLYINNSDFNKTIENQVKLIANTGVNYIAIGTPYDSEFIPYLRRWVLISRKYGLKIWFRGNFSGWEGWFGYKPLSRDDHKTLLKEFISKNGDLFADGDIFTSCTECENGGPGDPRRTGDVEGHRDFLIDEYKISRETFKIIGKNVAANYFPMNGDVARLIMNPATTQALGGLVVVDHYVPTPQQLNEDINEIAKISGGKVMLGEFGTPIPDIHGNLNETDQAEWIKKSLVLLARNQNLAGINYWTGFGGSTSLWLDDGTPKQAVRIITNYFKPSILKGSVKNEAGISIKEASVTDLEITVNTDQNGQFYIPFLAGEIEVSVAAPGYFPSVIKVPSDNKEVSMVLKKHKESPVFKFQKFLYQKFGI